MLNLPPVIKNYYNLTSVNAIYDQKDINKPVIT